MARGREARSPVGMTSTGWLDILARVWTRMGTTNLGLLAAGVAFYGLLSVFPAITAGIALIGLAFDPAPLLEQSQWLLRMLPAEASRIIESQLASVADADQSALGIAALVSVGIALWSASNATASLIQGLNVIYEEQDERGFVVTRLITIALTLALIFGLALSITIIAAIPAALSFAISGSNAADVALLLRWPFLFAVGAAGIAVLYRFGPDRRNARWRWISPGSVLACLLWVAGTFAFSFYVQSFASYNETFGTLAGAIILLTWLWLSSFVVLLGALLDAELEAQTAEDSTVGSDRPMGERGATKADNLGKARGEQVDQEEPPALATR